MIMVTLPSLDGATVRSQGWGKGEKEAVRVHGEACQPHDC